jgi:phosphoribosylformylglycinamidine (FGAM) synthase PurS component
MRKPAQNEPDGNAISRAIRNLTNRRVSDAKKKRFQKEIWASREQERQKGFAS